ncbi:efflux RND transporter periplasmic adaptor subunit [Congregibacter litoralis]|uniref:RND family efflux transporter, MFP subunit n=1 Tax=Congregibacter litoralis KT71 TaxID=314285 RepID=A4AA59_9GAMM|nr:efflux RND transporter periplasmic adaptor subunit [Congregibacter litoralis]EAQ96936.1 RND family efflux transporter, MFP subunit [Congregibacter litoralis KT71]
MPSLKRSAQIVATALLSTQLAVQLTACSEANDTAPQRESRGRAAVPVVVETVQLKARQTRVEAVGTARAHRSVSLFPEAAGEVVAVNFQPGDRVAEGDVLVALDSRDETLALELAELRLADAQRMLERYTQANSSVDRTVPETTVDTARTTLDSARIERDRAKIALQRRFVTAPFDGFVGITDVDAGDRIDVTTEITSIDDRSTLLVSFDVPEAFVGRLQTGDPVRIEVWSAERTEARGTVVDLGSRVDPLSRSFTARAEVVNDSDLLRPGMSFRVELDLVGKAFPAVPEVALQWGAEGAYIWIVENDQARQVPATLVQRQEGRVLVDADVPAGALVVGEGVQSMRNGIAVRTMDAEALARDARGVLTPAANEG